MTLLNKPGVKRGQQESGRTQQFCVLLVEHMFDKLVMLPGHNQDFFSI